MHCQEVNSWSLTLKASSILRESPGASRLRESLSLTVAVWKMTGMNIAAALSRNTPCMNRSTLILQKEASLELLSMDDEDLF